MKTRIQINNPPALKEKRISLRKNLTPAEASLWIILKNEQLGRRFRRQFSVGKYILDFYCHSEKLAIELDGAHHFTEEGMIADKKKDSFLQQLGIRTLRIENKAVFNNPTGVVDLIKSNFNPSVD